MCLVTNASIRSSFQELINSPYHWILWKIHHLLPFWESLIVSWILPVLFHPLMLGLYFPHFLACPPNTQGFLKLELTHLGISSLYFIPALLFQFLSLLVSSPSSPFLPSFLPSPRSGGLTSSWAVAHFNQPLFWKTSTILATSPLHFCSQTIHSECNFQAQNTLLAASWTPVLQV